MKLPPGTTMYIGPPAKPMSADISKAIGVAVGKFPDVREAHLPQVYVEGKIDPPAQVLVIVLEERAPSQAPKVMEVVRSILPIGAYLDIFEWHPNNPALSTVRSTGYSLDLNRKVN